LLASAGAWAGDSVEFLVCNGVIHQQQSTHPWSDEAAWRGKVLSTDKVENFAVQLDLSNKTVDTTIGNWRITRLYVSQLEITGFGEKENYDYMYEVREGYYFHLNRVTGEAKVHVNYHPMKHSTGDDRFGTATVYELQCNKAGRKFYAGLFSLKTDREHHQL
jgi:hypothetical protein